MFGLSEICLMQHYFLISTVDLSSMFRHAASFNQPINNWDVRRVKTIAGMFSWASAFN